EKERSQAIAYVSTALTLGNIIFPVLAGLAGVVHWRLAFSLYGLGIPLALLVLLTLPKKEATTPAKESLSSISGDSKKLSKVLKNPLILQLFLTLCLTSATTYAVVIYLPVYLNTTINSGTLLNGIVLASQAIGAAAISAFGVSKLTQNFGLILTTASGFGLMALALITIPQLSHLYGLLPITILFGIGIGLVIPTLYNLLSNLTPSQLQSSILAAGTGATFLGQFLCPTLFGLVVTHQGEIGVFYAAASLQLMLGLFLLATSKAKIGLQPK
ncbi:MAG: MFS transporter, partial [Moorea sp. SIO2B7]|nr:MFS transporter [Moorena sp. SIO2B7]